MAMQTEKVFVGLCALTAVIRLVELTVSRRHQAAMAARGPRPVAEAVFPWMVLLHTGIIFLGPVEVLSLGRPFHPVLGIVAFSLWAAAQALRWWAIAALGPQWNVKVVASTPSHGVVTRGPYRFIRHPNYVAVVVELVALPLFHTAWLTAVVGLAAHVAVLSARLAAEERLLFADPKYRDLMGDKPRFLPRVFLTPSRRGSAS